MWVRVDWRVGIDPKSGRDWTFSSSSLALKKRADLGVEGITGRNESQIMSESTKKPFIVCLGASAGGLEAIKAFFAGVSDENEIIWVIIQHLSPDYKSMMRDLLQSSTSMPIQVVESGMEAKPQSVYLIAPNTNLKITEEGQFVTEQQRHDYATPNLPIDIFFESMARYGRERAIGVILSGTGSDGTRGARMIRDLGGFVLVQSIESAKFDGMPKSIINNNLADAVDDVKALPNYINTLVSHPLAQGEGLSSIVSSESERKPLDQLFLMLMDRFKVDFSLYKAATVGRRIERRIQKCRKSSLEDYVYFASKHPEEIEALFSELLIGVTSFFRDLKLYEEIFKTTLLEYLRSTPEPRQLRIWTAGCSSGEEAYTLAMLFREVCDENKILASAKIFATDIDGAALTKASAGEYPSSVVNDVSSEMLAKYFIPRGDTYMISNKIREMVVFAKHDLLRDPPFTKIDLISCRNLLIYLSSAYQARILSSFSFSLRPGGMLLLGTSETLGEAEDLFETLDKKAKFFRLNSNSKARRGAPSRLPVAGDGLQQLYPRTVGRRNRSQTEITALEQLKVYLGMNDAMGRSNLMPFSALVDASHNVVRLFGSKPEIFRPLTGALETELTKLVVKELQVPISSGLSRAFRSGEVIRFRNIALDPAAGDDAKLVSISIMPFASTVVGSQFDHALVMVSDPEAANTPSDVTWVDADQQSRSRVVELEHELQITRENLHATIEELETSNEELQATNEELLASNEELQSTNEELQSVNEELHTVNNENHERLILMSQMRRNFDLLLQAKDAAVIYTDHEGKVLSYTPNAVRVFNILDQDIGRSITDISNQLTTIDFKAVMAKTLESGDGFQEICNISNDQQYRITIYREKIDSIDGVNQAVIVMEHL